MKLKLSLLTALVTTLASLSFSSLAQAQVSKETLKCQKTIRVATRLFVNKVADNIENCLLKVQQCNTKHPADVDDCVAKLLVVGKGHCAVGKLAGDDRYWGGGSAVANDPSQGAINKELDKLINKVSKCDFGSVDFTELGFSPEPVDPYELVGQLNKNTTGAACLAHKRVKVTMPNRDALVTQINDHPDTGNFPFELAKALLLLSSTCK